MSSIDLAQYMQERMKTLHLTATSAAGQSGISRQTWHKLLNADIEEARLSTLIRVADVLKVHPLNMLRIYFHGKVLSHASTQASGCTNFASGFVADVTYPDNSLVHIGQEFEKVWEVVNLGTEAWVGWHLQCVDEHLSVHTLPGDEYYKGTGVQYGLFPLKSRIPIPETQPGEHIRLHVQFRAPDVACTAISHWKSVNAQGEIVFPNLTGLYCMVKVVSL
jgi:transcriptional regulator with XRE-family HTH domain